MVNVKSLTEGTDVNQITLIKDMGLQTKIGRLFQQDLLQGKANFLTELTFV